MVVYICDRGVDAWEGVEWQDLLQHDNQLNRIDVRSRVVTEMTTKEAIDRYPHPNYMKIHSSISIPTSHEPSILTGIQ